MPQNISCNDDTCSCPEIVNDNLCCSTHVNSQLCLLPPAKDCVQITFKIQPGANITQNAGEICVCGLIKKIVEYNGVNTAGCEIRKVEISQDIPFHCCFHKCDFNEENPSDYIVSAIEVENICTTLSSRATRAGVDVFFCLKETDVVRVRISKPAPCKPCEPCAPSTSALLARELESFVY